MKKTLIISIFLLVIISVIIHFFNIDLVLNLKKINNLLNIEKMIYYLTGVEAKNPITYLKKEIPLLAHYTPDVLREEENILYQSNKNEELNIVKLKFNIDNDLRTTKEENTEQKETKKENKTIDNKNEKTIIIYHTHTSETYIDDPRTQDINGHVQAGEIGNVAKVGRELARELSSKYNYKVIHSTKVHDSEYALSYLNSRKTVKKLLNEEKNVDLILDIHRNGIENANRRDVISTIKGKRAAKIMFVVTNGNFDFAHLDLEDHHLKWQENLKFATKIENEIKKNYPNLLQKELVLRDTTYNQDLHPHSLLVEIGDFRNTTSEAIYSAKIFAEIIHNVLNKTQNL
ncbi:MAG: stage II sporulation protein P [Bacillota bacterium]